MALFRDLSGNGAGVFVEQKLHTIDLTSTDASVPSKASYVRAGAAGNIVMRPAGGLVDITVPVTLGEYVPIDTGTVIRRTGTTATPLLAMF